MQDDSVGGEITAYSCGCDAREQTSGGSFDVEFWLPSMIGGPVLYQIARKIKYQRVYNVDQTIVPTITLML